MNIKIGKLASVMLAIIICLSLTLVTVAGAEAPAVSEESSSVAVAQQTEEIPQASSEIRDTQTVPQTQDNQREEVQPEKKKDSDIPLFIGAGISVLMFLGVIVFCKMKGNR